MRLFASKAHSCHVAIITPLPSRSATMPVQVAITASGRMSLPADVRKRLGLGEGGLVYLEETADGVVLRTASQIVANARALAQQYADVPGTSVADFLERRVAESGE